MQVPNCDYNYLGMDEACVVLSTNDRDYNSSLYSLSSDCNLCPYSKISWIQWAKNTSIKINAAHSVTWRVYNDSGLEKFRPANNESYFVGNPLPKNQMQIIFSRNQNLCKVNGVICQFQPPLGEYGVYELIIDDQGCEFDILLDPHNRYTALAMIIGTVLCILFALSLGRCCKSLQNKMKKKGIEGNNEDEETHSTVKKRVLSIDTFRGISIILMIFVNNGAGGGYAYLEHATWNGLYIGDLVFPWFIWIMGVCMPISLSGQLSRGISRISIARDILKRSILLFLIGLCIASNGEDVSFQNLRIFGVLQRFSVAYFIVGLSYVFLSRRNETKIENEKFRDFYSLVPQWILALAIIALHCGITFCLPVPGCPTGYLGPGGRHEDGRFENCTGGATGYIDKIVLGTEHIYQRPTIDTVYGSGPFEPEGILGCLTTIFQTFLGVQTGKTLRIHRESKERIIRWSIMALLCGSISSALHFTSIIPINKNLWSLSFVFATTFFGLMLFVVCYLLVDVMAIWRGGPFRIPGMNALVMYVGHQICYQMLPFHWSIGEIPSHTWRTIDGFWQAGTWILVAYFLHRKKIYISL